MCGNNAGTDIEDLWIEEPCVGQSYVQNGDIRALLIFCTNILSQTKVCTSSMTEQGRSLDYIEGSF